MVPYTLGVSMFLFNLQMTSEDTYKWRREPAQKQSSEKTENDK